MEKYSQIVEEEEEDAYQEEEEEKYEENSEESEDDEFQFFQEPIKLQQFFKEESQSQDETRNQSKINCIEDYEQKDPSGYQNATYNEKMNKNSQQNISVVQIFSQKSLKATNYNNDDNSNNKIYKSQFAKQQSFNSMNQNKTIQTTQNNNIPVEDVTSKRPKTANNVQINKKLIPDQKEFNKPRYVINKMNVPKETYFAYRSLSPMRDQNQQRQSQLNITSPQFLLSSNHANSSLQLQKLAQVGILDESSIQQIEDQKQNILDIDQKVLFLKNKNTINKNNLNKQKKQNQTLPNFQKKDVSKIHFQNFQSKFTTSKIHNPFTKFKAERSSSDSPSKQDKNRYLPHRLIHVGQNTDTIFKTNDLNDKDRTKQKQMSLETEKSASPASQIEEKYMKAMKCIEKAYQLHDIVSQKNDISFNNQYLTIIRYTQQLKTPIDILDQEYIQASMYALSYNAYYIPCIKRQFPYILEVNLEGGELEIYVSKTENPNIENSDFLFANFDIPNKINYQKNEIKDGIFMNIFCKKILSEQSSKKIGNTNNMGDRGYLNQFLDKRKNALTNEYKNQLIIEKASYKEQKLKFEKNINFYVVEQSEEDQKKEDNFLRIRFKNKTCRNVIEYNKDGVRKYSPNERKEHLNKLKEEKQVKIIRAQYNKNLQKYQELGQDILTIQRKAERKQQLIDADGRLESEVRLLKQCFQYRWLQVFALMQIIKVFSYFMKAYKVKEARNLNLTNPMINLNKLMNGYLCRKLGKTKDERTFSRVYYCLKTRVKAFKKLMKHNAYQVAGEYLQQKIKIMIIQSKMMVYYKHIITIQRSYRNLLQIRDVMNVVNIKHWDVAFKTMLEDEQKFYDKSWISKPVLVDYKRRIEKNKVKTLAHFVKGVQSQYFSKLKQYQTKLKKLPFSYQIAYQFCGKAFRSYFEKQYAKQINEGFQQSLKKTTEYLIEALKFMVKHNIYQIVNNPIIAYEKEKQKQLEAQKKKNIENLRQKEILLQKQREEEFIQQKIQRNTRKMTIQPQDNDSGQSSSSQESIGENQKATDISIKKDNKSKIKKQNNQNEQTPLSFQDYLQSEEQKIEENQARRVSKIKINHHFNKGENHSPLKNLDHSSIIKKQHNLASKLANSSLNLINLEEINGAEEIDSTPRHVNQNNNSNKLFAKNFHDETNSKSSGFKKEKLNSQNKHEANQHGNISNEKKNNIMKKHHKKISKKSEDIDEKDENDNEEMEEEEEYEENENYKDEEDNGLANNKGIIKRQNQKKQSIISQSLNQKEEEVNNDESNLKVVFELTGQQQPSTFKKNELKQNNYKAVLKSNLSSSGSQQSIQSQSQLSQTNLSSSSNLNTSNSIQQTKQQISQAELQSQFYQNKEQQNSSSLQAGLAAMRPNKNQKQKKKKQKKKKIETKEENKLEEIKEGDEAIQTFWANFIHYPIFTSYPNMTEMKELIIKLLKKL